MIIRIEEVLTDLQLNSVDQCEVFDRYLKFPIVRPNQFSILTYQLLNIEYVWIVNTHFA